MINKKIILYFATFLVLASAAFAVDLNTGIISYWTMDTANISGSTLFDQTGNYDANLVNSPLAANGIINQARGLDVQNNRYIEVGDVLNGTGSEFTISCWVAWNDTQLSQNQPCFSTANNVAGANRGIFIKTPGSQSGNIQFVLRFGTGDVQTLDSNFVAVDNQRYHVVATYNGTTMKLYVNGKLNVSTSYTKSFTWEYSNFDIGRQEQSGTNILNGSVDEVGVWGVTFNASQVEALYSSGINGSQYPFASAAVGGTINITNVAPNNNTQFDYNDLELNVTTSSSISNWNCSLYLNETLNQTISHVDTGVVQLNFSKTLTDGSYNYYFKCQDGTSTSTSATNIFYIDTIEPTITDNFTNNSYFMEKNLTGQFNFTDTQLINSYNFSVDGVQIDGAAGLGVKKYVYNLSWSPLNLSPGSHILSIRAADGHTAKELRKDYKIRQNNYLSFEIEGGVWVKIEEIKGNSDAWNTKRLKDRYTFDYIPQTQSSAYTFEISSNEEIYILEDESSKWNKWLTFGDHWLDFYSPKNPNAVNDFYRINETKVRVKVSNIKNMERVKFESIGDLNIVVKNYTFFTSNTTLIYSDPTFATQDNTIILDINNINQSVTSAASLLWNGTIKTSTKSINSLRDRYTASFNTPSIDASDENISFVWFYNVSKGSSNESGNITNTQQIFDIGLDNCTTYTGEAINFTIRDSADNEPVLGNIQGFFQAWTTSPNNPKEFNLSWTSSTDPRLCISPSNATYNIYGQMEYTSTGYETFNYYIDNLTISNNTQKIDLYLTNGTSDFIFIVTDQNDNPIENAYIHILEYDLPTNSFKVSQILKTDSSGKDIGNVILVTQWYKFLIYVNGEIKLETQPTKLTGTEREFRVNLETDYFVNYNKYNSVTCGDVTFNNATKNFGFTYSDEAQNLDQACLRVIKRTINGESTIGNTCQSDYSGQILVNIGNDTGTNQYLGTATITIGDNTFACGEPKSVKFGSLKDTWGLLGIFFSFLIILTLALVGIWDPRVSIALVIVGLAAINVLGLYHLNWPILIGIIILAIIYIIKMNKEK